MKWIVLLILICAAVVFWRYRTEQHPTTDATGAPRTAMALARVVEPYVTVVTSSLDLTHPEDLVPALDVTRQRVLRKKPAADPERAELFNRADAAMSTLTALAEERTRTLHELLKNRNGSAGPLDRKDAPGTSEFFSTGLQKRWDDMLKHARPTLNQQVEALRAAERQWNVKVGNEAPVEAYDLPPLEPLFIPTGQPAATPAFGAAASGTRPWRAAYYQRYGFKPPAAPSR